MPPSALKAVWTVTAGVIPGHRMDELSKQWTYTSDDFEADFAATEGETPGPHPEKEPTRFEVSRNAATAYFVELNDPRRLNWARVEFMWL